MATTRARVSLASSPLATPRVTSGSAGARRSTETSDHAQLRREVGLEARGEVEPIGRRLRLLVEAHDDERLAVIGGELERDGRIGLRLREHLVHVLGVGRDAARLLALDIDAREQVGDRPRARDARLRAQQLREAPELVQHDRSDRESRRARRRTRAAPRSTDACRRASASRRPRTQRRAASASSSTTAGGRANRFHTTGGRPPRLEEQLPPATGGRGRERRRRATRAARPRRGRARRARPRPRPRPPSRRARARARSRP